MTGLRSTIQLAALLVLGLASMAMAQSPGPLNGQVFGSGNRALVVVVHGDVSKGGPATYHYDLARRIADQNRGVTVFALVRPGYTGQSGAKSPGSNNGRRDHYTKQNNALVAKTIQNLAKATGNSKVIGIGHSGGAAQVGAIAGMYPGLIDSAILVSCPCNITEWRAKRGKSAWRNSLSPHTYIKHARGTHPCRRGHQGHQHLSEAVAGFRRRGQGARPARRLCAGERCKPRLQRPATHRRATGQAGNRQLSMTAAKDG
ncbi:MAG: alpha/beta hydrolase [Roseovarius pacificus]|nr:alpha/beta hydrolase [Roseovarius pacificus]